MNIQLKRFDLNNGVASGARPSMVPAPEGEYCLYSEICSVLKTALDVLTAAKPSPEGFIPQVTCGHKVPVDANGMAYTYCMEKLGHEGQCK